MTKALRNVPLVALSMGDPAGIGPEVILKAAAAMAHRRGAPSFLVVGDFDVMQETRRRIDESVPDLFEWNPGAQPLRPSDGIAVLSVGKLKPNASQPGHPTVQGGEAAYRYIVEGARMAMRGEADALVTAPISKEWLNRAGHHYPGHSELLAKLSKARLWRMMFASDELRLALVTVHMGLAKVSRTLSRDGVFQTIRLLAEYLRDSLGVSQPRISVLGFNPHAGENGLFGDEEQRVITPAIKQAQRAGIAASGPVAPDTAFISSRRGSDFDAAVAMYHDQGLIALKTLEFDRAVNITLGLPFIRTSPDHGTAFEIAGRGIANPSSTIAAIEFAAKAARGRRIKHAA